MIKLVVRRQLREVANIHLRSHSGVPPQVVSLPQLQFADTGTREQHLLNALCVQWVLVDLQLTNRITNIIQRNMSRSGVSATGLTGTTFWVSWTWNPQCVYNAHMYGSIRTFHTGKNAQKRKFEGAHHRFQVITKTRWYVLYVTYCLLIKVTTSISIHMYTHNIIQQICMYMWPGCW